MKQRTTISIHATYDQAKLAEAILMDKGADPNFLQVRRMSNKRKYPFELVQRMEVTK